MLLGKYDIYKRQYYLHHTVCYRDPINVYKCQNFPNDIMEYLSLSPIKQFCQQKNMQMPSVTKEILGSSNKCLFVGCWLRCANVSPTTIFFFLTSSD